MTSLSLLSDRTVNDRMHMFFKNRIEKRTLSWLPSVMYYFDIFFFTIKINNYKLNPELILLVIPNPKRPMRAPITARASPITVRTCSLNGPQVQDRKTYQHGSKKLTGTLKHKYKQNMVLNPHLSLHLYLSC